MTRLIAARDYVRMPWKNGLGITSQIAIHPPHATLENFLWRLSVAEVASGGPFSLFPGYDRFLVVWRGEGLVLRRGEEKTPLSALVPFHFSGDEPLTSDLPFGPIHDFNFIYRRDRVAATCHVIRLNGAATLAGFLFCAIGSFVSGAVAVCAGDAALLDDPVVVSGTATIIQIVLSI